MKLRTLLALAFTSTSLLVNSRADITNGLVLYFNLDEGTGTTVNDSSGLGNNGTIVSVVGSAQWTNGWIAGGLSVNSPFPANTNYISVPDAASLNFTNQNAFTIAAWVKMPNTQSNGVGVIAKGTGNGGEQYDLDVNANRYRLVVRNAAGAATTLSTTVAPANNLWQHVVAVYDGTNAVSKTIRLYLNGVQNAVTTNASFTSLRYTVNPVAIGARQGAATGPYNLVATNTTLDEVRLYNRPLSASDVYELYVLNGKLAAITTQPRSITNYVGDYAPFNVAIDNNNSTLPVGYQWQWYGTNLPGATGATLVLTNVQLANSGPYSVTISNAVGLTNSATAYLQVQPLPAANIAAGLVGYYKFDDAAGSTTAADSSGNGNPGKLVNYVDYNACWVAGLTNGALNFNSDPSTSSSNLVALPDVGVPAPPVLDFYASQALTVAAWVKAPTGQTNGGAIIAKGTGGGGEQFALDMNGTTYRFYVRATNGVSFPLTTTASPNSAWQHLAVTFDAIKGIQVFYVNGQIANVTVAPTSLNTNSHEISIGCRQSGTAAYNLPFTGIIDDLHLYNRALTSADVAALYATGGFYPPSFVLQPQGASKYVGEDYTFTASVNGTVPFKYQWKLNGANVAGATNLTLVLTNVQLSNAGSYTLFVTNGYGFTNSDTVLLQVTNFNLTNMLGGWWKFDDGTGFTALDSSANGNNGSLNNFPGDNSAWVSGRIGGALSFNQDGSGDDYVSVPDAPALNFDTGLAFSLTAWVRGSATQPANGAGIICKGTGAGGEQFALDSHTDTVTAGYRLYVRNAAGTSFAVPSPIAPNGRWQHLVGVFDGVLGTLRVYVNGQLVASGAGATSLLPNTHEVSIGNRQSAAAAYNLPFIGVIDDPRIYSRALSATDVQALYAQAGVLPPTVYTQPKSVTNYAHGSALFSVDADGTGTIGYQWLRNGTSVPGATNATLPFADLQITDAGTYSVRVTDANTSVLSSNAILSVLVLPPPNLTNELIAYWTFDETNGTAAADSSGQGNSVSLFDFPPNDVQWVPGVIGGALHFSSGGDANYANYRAGTDSALPLDNTDLFSFSFWAKRDPGATGVNPRFLSPNTTTAGQHWVLWTPGTGVGFYVPVKSAEPSSNVWHHFVALYNRPAGTYSLFVDGARQVADAGGYVRNDPTSAPWFIGHSESATSSVDSWTGLMDDVRIYNRLLNYNDIQALYLLAGAPQLSVTANGRSVTVSWSIATTGYHLQSAGVLGGIIWSNEPTAPVPSADGASQSLTFSADAAAERYYRLSLKP